jgi:hypothetical protein
LRDYIVEKEFEHCGYKCVVTFGSSGWRCGYVGIDKNNSLYEKEYMDYLDIKKEDLPDKKVDGVFPLLISCLDEDERIRIDAYFNCHGGITYSDGGKDSKYPIESDLWWFGFDCAHYNDGKDLDLALERFPHLEECIIRMMDIDSRFRVDGINRTEEYVVDNCKKLAEQLKLFDKESEETEC